MHRQDVLRGRRAGPGGEPVAVRRGLRGVAVLLQDALPAGPAAHRAQLAQLRLGGLGGGQRRGGRGLDSTPGCRPVANNPSASDRKKKNTPSKFGIL